MATNTLNTRVVICSKTTSQWANVTTVPLKGEICIEWISEDSNTLPKMKVGNGTDVYADLPYATFTEKEIKAFISQAAFNLQPATASALGGVKIGSNVNVTTDGTISIPAASATSASAGTAGVMSVADKYKLNNVQSGAEVNQNAFSNVKVGTTTIAADAKTDTLELVAGSNITLTPDATNDKVTIAATDTTYDVATTSANGLMSSTDKSKLNGIEAGANATNITIYDDPPTETSMTEASVTNDTTITFKNSKISTSSGKIDITVNDASTTQKGIVQLTNSTSSESLTTAATPYAVKRAYDSAEEAHGRLNNLKIDGILFDVDDTIVRYGVCTTAANTAAKTVIPTKGTFVNTIEAGARITVKFNNANTANSPTLNVNGTGAKNIFHKGSQITSGVNKGLLAGVCDFVYDGTQWHLVGNYHDTTYSTATTSANGLMSSTDKSNLDSLTSKNHITAITDGSTTAGVAAKSTSLLFDNATVNYVADDDSKIEITPKSASTSQKGIVQLNSATNSTSTSQAATPSAVKSAYDLASAAMPKSGGTFTGAVTLNADPTANLGAATKQYVDTQITSKIAASDAMVFKGTLGTGGTVTAVPTSNVTKGDTYKIITAGTWAGYSGCKVGDLLIAMTTGASVTANTTNWAYVPSGDESTTSIKYSTTTQNLTTSAQTGAITVGEAATKQVDTSISAGSSSTKLPTSKAVATFVEGKGYLTSSGTIANATNATNATQLKNSRDFSITGGATAAAVSFNGTQNVALNVTNVSTTVLSVPSGDVLIIDGNFT